MRKWAFWIDGSRERGAGVYGFLDLESEQDGVRVVCVDFFGSCEYEAGYTCATDSLRTDGGTSVVH